MAHVYRHVFLPEMVSFVRNLVPCPISIFHITVRSPAFPINARSHVLKIIE